MAISCGHLSERHHLPKDQIFRINTVEHAVLLLLMRSFKSMMSMLPVGLTLNSDDSPSMRHIRG